MILNGSKTFKDYEIKDGNVIMDVFGSSNRKEIRVTIKTAKREELPLTILETFFIIPKLYHIKSPYINICNKNHKITKVF